MKIDKAFFLVKLPRKKISSNIFFLALSHSANYLTPLIAIPILTAKVGIDSYGLIAFSQSIMVLFTTFVDFGITMVGIKMIRQADTQEEQAKYAGIILFSKSFLLVTGFALLLGLVVAVPFWSDYQSLIIGSYLIVIGRALFPSWSYEGNQKMPLIAVMNAASRLGYIASLIFFIQDKSDVVWVNVFNGGAYSIVSLFALCLGGPLLGHYPVRVSFREIISLLKRCFPFLLSDIAKILFTGSGIPIAGLILPVDLLGQYSVLDKIIGTFRGFFSFVYGGLYPEVCVLVKKRGIELYRFFVRNLKSILLLVVLGSITFSLYGADVIIRIAPEMSDLPLDIYTVLIALIPVLILLNLPIGLTLMAAERRRDYFKYNLLVSLIFISCCLASGILLGIFGIILSYIVTELAAMPYGYSVLLRTKLIAIR